MLPEHLLNIGSLSALSHSLQTHCCKHQHLMPHPTMPLPCLKPYLNVGWVFPPGHTTISPLPFCIAPDPRAHSLPNMCTSGSDTGGFLCLGKLSIPATPIEPYCINRDVLNGIQEPLGFKSQYCCSWLVFSLASISFFLGTQFSHLKNGAMVVSH